MKKLKPLKGVNLKVPPAGFGLMISGTFKRSMMVAVISMYAYQSLI
jgi:hypothetical protein